jgi:hypothetical protein
MIILNTISGIIFINFVETYIPIRAPGTMLSEINRESIEILCHTNAITINFNAFMKKKNKELEPMNSLLFSVSLKKYKLVIAAAEFDSDAIPVKKPKIILTKGFKCLFVLIFLLLSLY